MSLDEYYRRLELPGTASQADIKRAYRRLRAKYHPDRNKGRESTVEPVFKRVQEAFEILMGKREAPVSPTSAKAPAAKAGKGWSKDPGKDAGRDPGRHPGPGSAREDHKDSGRDGSKDSSKETSAHTAAREFRSGPPMRGANCLVELFVPLEAAIHGGAVEATYPVNAACRECGQSRRSHASAFACAACDGRGLTPHGMRCAACAGTGRPLAGRLCAACAGTGVRSERKSQAVPVPAGAWDGQRLVVEGGGQPGVNGGAPGDAIFSVAIVCDSAFRRDGLNLACEIEVDFVTATLGGSFETHVLGHPLQVAIAPNAQPGSTIRLRGQGLADRHGKRGDLTLQVVLGMPAAVEWLSDEERHQLRKMFDAAGQRAARVTAKEGT